MDHHFFDLETTPASHDEVLRRVREFLVWSGYQESSPLKFERGKGLNINSRKSYSLVTLTPLEGGLRVHYQWRGLGLPSIGPMSENQFGEFQDALRWGFNAEVPTIDRTQQSTSAALFQLIFYTLVFVFVGIAFISGNRTGIVLVTTLAAVLTFVLKGTMFSLERPPLQDEFPLRP